MVSEKSKRTIEELDKGRYVNDKQIYLGGVPFSGRDILVKVPIIPRLNAYFVGGTGRGKTQLANDVVGYFQGSACYAMGRPDFEPSELLKQIRLGKLKDVQTDKELVELTENVRKCLFFVDEMNRAPPIVQNYFFDFGDGKIVHNGQIQELGKSGYSILLATGNLGDGEYVGVSDSDRALKDRMHIILKMDHPDFRPTELNLFDVFRGKKNPRADMPDKSNVSLDDILTLNSEFLEREVHPILPLLGIYFTEGLDYLANVKGHSKIACDTRWPNVEGIRADTDENKIFPLSPRAVFSSIGVAGALEMIAEAKGKNPDRIKLFLDSLKLTVPYSGVLSPVFVEQEYNGDVYGAFEDLLGEKSRNREDILKKAPYLEEALSLAEIGIKDDALLEKISKEKGKWAPVRRAIEDYTERNTKEPTEERKKLKEIILATHKR